MRVIKDGKLPGKEFKIICYNCRTEFEYDEKDVDDEYENEKDSETWLHVKCPLSGCPAKQGVGKDYIDEILRARVERMKNRCKRGRPSCYKKQKVVQDEPENAEDPI